jgi:hypothetical protein
VLFQHLYNQLNIGCLASHLFKQFLIEAGLVQPPQQQFGWQHDQEAIQNNIKIFI